MNDLTSPATAGSCTVHFVNDYDLAVRSTVKRHVAYHQSAQRRHRRSKLLLQSRQTRYLDWRRRCPTQSSETSIPITSTFVPDASASSALDPSGQPGSSSSALVKLQFESELLSNQTVSPSFPLMDISRVSHEDLMVQRCECSRMSYTTKIAQVLKSTVDLIKRCPQTTNRTVMDSIVAYIRKHEVPRQLLLAYLHATSPKAQTLGNSMRNQVDAHTYYGRGTNVLWNRLRHEDDGICDTLVQAVLLLVARAADLGQADEVQLHLGGLRSMVGQRGGINSFASSPLLLQQLRALGASRTYHLTLDCEFSCPSALRFQSRICL